MRQPWFKLFPGDWRQCPELRACSAAARGVWMDLMCLAHQAERYGHVEYDSAETLALSLGIHPTEFLPAFEELERRKVFTRASPTDVFSRRMVLDEQRRLAGVENGRRGGNPALKAAGATPLSTDLFCTPVATPYPTTYTQKSEVRSQNQNPPTPQGGEPPAAAVNGHTKPKQKPKSVIDVESELSGIDVWIQDAARAWVAYRAEKRLGAYTPTGFRALVKTIRDMGAPRVRVAMQFSMARNYQGLIEPNGNGLAQSNKPQPKTDRDILFGSAEWVARHG